MRRSRGIVQESFGAVKVFFNGLDRVDARNFYFLEFLSIKARA
mgnify:FL=1